MKILLYNPNTTVSMTVGFTPAALHAAAPTTEVIAETAAVGPASIEGYYDEALCVPPMLHRFSDLEQEGFDAAIIACFDDTGLDAARSLLSIPVFGLCQSAAVVASTVCERVAVVTTMPQSVPPLSRLLHSYIGAERSAGVYAAGIPVLDLENPSDATLARLFARCEQALDSGADGLILGCAGLSQLATTISEKFGVPVIEPIAAATKLAEATCALGLKTSKSGGWTPPRDKVRT